MKFCCYLLLILLLACSESSMSQNQNGATGRGQRIVVIDSGIFIDEAESQQRITHQWCYSREDEEVAGEPGHRDGLQSLYRHRGLTGLWLSWIEGEETAL